MLRYILRRLVSGVFLLVAIATLSFALLRMGAPSNVGRQIEGVKATQEIVDSTNKKLGLDKPIVTQYFNWARRAVVGDFGKTWKSSGEISVMTFLKDRVPVTITVVTLSLVFAGLLAVVFGAIAGLRGRVADKSVQLAGLIGFAIPGYLIAFALVNIFSIRYHLFNATGYTKPTDSVTGWLKSVTLPVISLSFASLVALTLQIRGSVKDSAGLDYVRTLRSRGLSTRRVVFKHVLRNAAGPALAVMNTQFIGLLGGAVFVEQIFNIPGMGPLALSGAVDGDVPIVLGVVVITAVLVVVVNLMIDLLTAWLNPKVRLT